MAGGLPEPDVVVAYHATCEHLLDSIRANGLVDDGSGEWHFDAPDPDIQAVYLWGEEAEAVSFCKEWDRDTIVEVDAFGLDYEDDPDMRGEGAFGAVFFGIEPTDYSSAFRVLGSIGPERILDAWPVWWGTPVPTGFNRHGKPRRYYGEDGE